MKFDLALIRSDGFEAQYVGYQRVQNIQGWLKYDGGALVNAFRPIDFPLCTQSYTAEQIDYFIVFCDELPFCWGKLGASLYISKDVQPSFAPGGLQIVTGGFEPPAEFRGPLRINRQATRIGHDPLQDPKFVA